MAAAKFCVTTGHLGQREVVFDIYKGLRLEALEHAGNRPVSLLSSALTYKSLAQI